MRLSSLLFCVCISLSASAQNNFTVSMNGIGILKIGMKKAEVEKLTSQPIKLNNLLKEDWTYDTVTVKIDDIDFTLVFDKQYIDEKKYDFTLTEIGSANPALKTKSGITIGDDKFRIISTYEGYTMWIVPDYENDYTTRSKTKTTIFLFGDNTSNTILFHLFMNKVESISVAVSEGYD